MSLFCVIHSTTTVWIAADAVKISPLTVKIEKDGWRDHPGIPKQSIIKDGLHLRPFCLSQMSKCSCIPTIRTLGVYHRHGSGGIVEHHITRS